MLKNVPNRRIELIRVLARRSNRVISFQILNAKVSKNIYFLNGFNINLFYSELSPWACFRVKTVFITKIIHKFIFLFF
jgi:hypothetical protein